MLCLFIWLRFIRERLPREIPFNLNLITLFFIICTCIIFLLSLIIYLFVKNSYKNTNMIIEAIFKPLKILDTEFKLYFEKSFTLFFNKNFKKLFNLRFQLYILEIIPRLVMLSAFTIDIVLYNKIFYTYKMIVFLSINYVIRYIIYSLNALKEDIMIKVDEIVEIHQLDSFGPIISIKDFIDIQTVKLYLEKQKELPFGLWVRYEFIERSVKKLNLKRGEIIDTQAIKAYQTTILSTVIKINAVLFIYYKQDEKYKIIKMLIALIYLILWSYILIKSIHTLCINDIILLLKTLYNLEEPFSGIINDFYDA